MRTDDELIAALREHGSTRKTAAALGIDRRSLMRRLPRLALKGYSPAHNMTHTVPDGYAIKGVSTLYREDGTVAAQWVKSQADAERREALVREALAAMASDLPRVKPVKARAIGDSDKLNLFVITDYHLGMLAWGEETRGEPWDLDIAANLLVNWITEAACRAPKAGTAVLAQLGDFIHFDGLEAITPAHHNLLDADTRYQKVVRTAIRVLRTAVEILRERHPHVHVIMAEGNHDPAGSIWLREWFAAMYEKEPRVTVDTSPDPYYCVEHGDTALFFHHGHKAGMKDAPEIFAAKFRDVFGRTKYAYAHLGHLHHNEAKESRLMTIERHRTLAAADAYASRGGWLSGRDAKVITYSRKYGEVGRVILSPDAVRDAA